MKTLIVTAVVICIAIMVGLMAQPPLAPGQITRACLAIATGGVLAAILTKILGDK